MTQAAGPSAPSPPLAESATPALVVGIFSFFVPIIGPVSIWLGLRAQKEIRDSQGRLSGEGRATAGLVLGVIGTVLLAVGLLAILAVGLAMPTYNVTSAP
jgi:uncharacterized Tic20 family protein